jgi:hypothetical protein
MFYVTWDRVVSVCDASPSVGAVGVGLGLGATARLEAA